MEGIYGDMLAFFPEMFDTVQWFTKEPKIGAGYTNTADGIVDVIIMPKGRFLLTVGANTNTRTNQSQNDLISENDKEYIWAAADSPLQPGMFVIDSKDNRLCRITGKADWARYGGFICWEFDIIQGTTGEDTREKASVIKGGF